MGPGGVPHLATSSCPGGTTLPLRRQLHLAGLNLQPKLCGSQTTNTCPTFPGTCGSGRSKQPPGLRPGLQAGKRSAGEHFLEQYTLLLLASLAQLALEWRRSLTILCRLWSTLPGTRTNSATTQTRRTLKVHVWALRTGPKNSCRAAIRTDGFNRSPATGPGSRALPPKTEHAHYTSAYASLWRWGH